MRTEIEYCYLDGDLHKALANASKFVKRIGEANVEGIYATNADDIGWTVCVVWIDRSQK